MGELIILDECRCIEATYNEVDGFITISETLDLEKHTVTLSMDELFKVFTLIVDTVNKRAAI